MARSPVPGSLIATSEDYARCYRELGRGLLGARLKELLATKAIVFAGYSLRDSDFARVYKLIASRMGELLPRSYLVTIDEGEPPSVARGMHVIGTTGTHFLSELARQIPAEEFVPESRLQAVPMMRAIVRELHHELLDASEMSSDPALLMCASYQDGLIDAFDHIVANAPKGQYNHCCHTVEMVSRSYPLLREQREADGRWLSVAYIEGFVAGLTFLISDGADRKLMPIYYVHGAEPLRTRDDYERVAPSFAQRSPEAFAYVRYQAQRLAPSVVFQHLLVLL
jgi:SIR2-like domain